MISAAGRSCLRHRAHAAPEMDKAQRCLSGGDGGVSLEEAEDMKQNGLEGNFREVMRGSETGTELGLGLEEHVPVSEGEDEVPECSCALLCASCLENT